jgi:glycosyltransferase involved in cell wall biosynthesis
VTIYQNERICLIPLTNAVSGTERIVSDITRALHAHQIPVGLVLPAGEALDQLAQDLRRHTDTITRINTVAGKKAFGRNFLPALKFFQAWKPTLVHFHCPHHRWGLDVLLAATLSGVPHLIRTEHNPLMESPKTLPRMLLRLSDQGTKTFTYVSKGNQRRFEQLLPHRVGRGQVIANGIDPLRFTPTSNTEERARIRKIMGFSPDSKIAVYVGSFGDRRSLRTIFQAFQHLLSQDSVELARSWRLLIIGAGTQEEEAIPAHLGIEPFVHFAGRRKDVAEILPHCDLFVTASAFEGMSIAILEAWACGLPVLATQVDGIADVIGDKELYQLMVPHGDVYEYARNWYSFMKNPSDLLAVHMRATDHVRSRLTTSYMMKSYLQMYAVPETVSENAPNAVMQI